MRGGTGTPAADAFYMPADYCRLAQLWLPWPADPQLQEAVAAVARAAAEFAPVHLIVNTGLEEAARAACGAGTLTDVLALPHLSARLRDIGPTFLVDGKGGSAAVNWRFNGWGGRTGAEDAGVAHALLGSAEVRRFRGPLTLEGSSIVADGRGTLLVLSSAMFDTGRNAGLGHLEAVGMLQNWLGGERVIGLPEAHSGDTLNTDIRALAAFCAPGVVAMSATEDSAVLARAIELMAGARDAQGNLFQILRLPAPPLSMYPLSYTNFVPVNGGVLMPAFDADNDARAADMLAEVFPGHVICPVPAMELAKAGLTLSSLVLPHPAPLLERDRVTVLPRAAWSQPEPDAAGLLQTYIDMAEKSD